MVKIALIVGCGRSGTTLLQRVLSSHPGILCVRETFFYSIINKKERFNQRQNVSSDYVVRSLQKYWWMKEIITDWQGYERFLFKQMAGEMRLDDQIYFSILNFANHSKRCAVIVEKTPEHCMEMDRLIRTYPYVSVIGMLRDPYDVLLSYKKLPNGPSFVVAVMNMWITFLAEEKNVHRSSRYLRVSYETLTHESQDSIEKILAFLNVAHLDLSGPKFQGSRLQYSPEQAHHQKSNELIMPNMRKARISSIEYMVLKQMIQSREIEEYGYFEKRVPTKYLVNFGIFIFIIADKINVNIFSRYRQYVKRRKVKKRHKIAGI